MHVLLTLKLFSDKCGRLAISQEAVHNVGMVDLLARDLTD